MLILAVSLYLFSRMGTEESFWSLLPAMLLGGVGMSGTMAPVTAAAMGSVRPDKAGVGSAVLNSMRQVGGSLGIAVMGAIVAASASGTIVGSPEGATAFLRGFHHALEVAALIAAAGGVLAFATLRHVRHPEPGREPQLAEAA
jgi:hypothetical protein